MGNLGGEQNKKYVLLGTIVLSQTSPGDVAKIFPKGEADSLLDIIDGLQRLLTRSLLFQAIRRVLLDLHQQSLSPEVPAFLGKRATVL